MADVNGIALMWAICAVDDKVWALQTQIDSGNKNDPALPDLEDELLSYMNTATDLRQAYEEACRHSSKLTAYEKLVRKYSNSAK
jgi:hypothetical protein